MTGTISLMYVDVEHLRADVQAARAWLQIAREAIANNQITTEDGRLFYRAAVQRYAAALEHFSRLVVHGRFQPN